MNGPVWSEVITQMSGQFGGEASHTIWRHMYPRPRCPFRAGSGPGDSATHQAPGLILQGNKGWEGGSGRQPIGIAGKYPVGHEGRAEAADLGTEPALEEGSEGLIGPIGSGSHQWLGQ